MKFKEISQLSKEEREKKLKELELELIKLNAQVATGTPPKNSGHLKRLKKDIARIMLLKKINEKILVHKKHLNEQHKQFKPEPKGKQDQKQIKKQTKKQNE